MSNLIIDPATLSDPNIRLSDAQREVMLAIVDAKGSLKDALIRQKWCTVDDPDFDPVRDSDEVTKAQERVETAAEFYRAQVARLDELDEYEREQLKLGLVQNGVLRVE
jgi:hypothetical protein